MKKSFIILLTISIAVLALTGCGKVSSSIANTYPLENVVPSEIGSDVANIYRAQDKTIMEMVNEISSKDKPLQISKEDSEKMFLVYDDSLITVMKDLEEPNDVLIEVANRQFVKDNYNLSFFEAYLIANIVGNIFGAGYNRKYRGYVGSGGYTRYGGTLDSKTFKDYYGSNGSVRTGSAGNSSTRGGGPGVGK